MISSKDSQNVDEHIAGLYRLNPHAGAAIESYLHKCFATESGAEKVARVEALAQSFKEKSAMSQEQPESTLAQPLRSLVPLLLGTNIADSGCSDDELAKRLVESLNTVFDTLNELILAINTAFVGRASETETIRLIIRSNVDDSAESISLQSYLDQIKAAFSIMHDAFTDAAMIKMQEMLTELDPQLIAKSLNGGLKIGPFQKAEMFRIYEEKHRTLENWLHTGLLKDALLREFERNCQKLYANK